MNLSATPEWRGLGILYSCLWGLEATMAASLVSSASLRAP